LANPTKPLLIQLSLEVVMVEFEATQDDGDKTDMAENQLRLAWRTVAIGSLLLNLGAIAAIVTVAAVKSADALTTVALALSVIAFTCQLVIFCVQSWQSTDHLRQAEKLNAETLATMTEMRTRLEGTHDMVRTQYRELLHLSALKVAPKITEELRAESGADVTVTSSRVEEIVGRAMSSVDMPEPLRTSPGMTPTFAARAAYHFYRSWPGLDAAARESINNLLKLDSAVITSYLANIGGSLIGIWLNTHTTQYSKSDDPLIGLGLVVKVDSNTVKVTSKGCDIGRIFTAKWPPPNYPEDVVHDVAELRQRPSERATNVLVQALENLDI
jgi:hypothetical protein